MRMSRIAVTFFGLALLVSGSVLAKEANTNKGTLHLDDKVTIDGTPVNPGNYKVEWNGDGPDVQVTLLKGNQTVATFPARLSEEVSAPHSDAYGSEVQPNGGKALTAIYFGGKHYALQVEPASAQANQQNNSSSAQ